ncbi:MAG: hypothetical protein WD512_07040 [Candidatus Paceibacterota bacterium]
MITIDIELLILVFIFGIVLVGAGYYLAIIHAQKSFNWMLGELVKEGILDEHKFRMFILKNGK